MFISSLRNERELYKLLSTSEMSDSAYELQALANSTIIYQQLSNVTSTLTTILLHIIFIYHIILIKPGKRVGLERLMLAQAACEIYASIYYVIEDSVRFFFISFLTMP